MQTLRHIAIVQFFCYAVFAFDSVRKYCDACVNTVPTCRCIDESIRPFKFDPPRNYTFEVVWVSIECLDQQNDSNSPTSYPYLPKSNVECLEDQYFAAFVILNIDGYFEKIPSNICTFPTSSILLQTLRIGKKQRKFLRQIDDDAFLGTRFSLMTDLDLAISRDLSYDTGLNAIKKLMTTPGDGCVENVDLTVLSASPRAINSFLHSFKGQNCSFQNYKRLSLVSETAVTIDNNIRYLNGMIQVRIAAPMVIISQYAFASVQLFGINIENITSIGTCILYGSYLLHDLNLHFKPNWPRILVSDDAFACMHGREIKFICSMDSAHSYSFSSSPKFCSLVEPRRPRPRRINVHGDKCLPLLGSFECLNKVSKGNEQIYTFEITATEVEGTKLYIDLLHFQYIQSSAIFYSSYFKT